MRSIICSIALLACLAAPLSARTLIHALPVLPSVYFEAGSSAIPARYRLLADSSATIDFDERRIGVEALGHHHHILNVIGARMRREPSTSVALQGYSSNGPAERETLELSATRAGVVREYLIRVWRIDSSRIVLLSPCREPMPRQTPADTLQARMHRRVDILTRDLNLSWPVVVGRELPDEELDPDIPDFAVSVQFWLVGFDLDSMMPGPVNDRIIDTLLVPYIRPSSSVAALSVKRSGEPPERSTRLSTNRPSEVRRRLEAKRVKWHRFDVGDDAEMYIFPEETPEAVVLNRAVIVWVVTPGE